MTLTTEGVHTIESRIVDNVGHASDWRTDTVRIDKTAPTAALSCGGSSGWNASAVTCTPTADGGPSGLASLTLVNNGVSTAVTSGQAVAIAGDGVTAHAPRDRRRRQHAPPPSRPPCTSTAPSRPRR